MFKNYVSLTERRAFVWFAEYNDNTDFCEFQNKEFTNFDDIDKTKLLKFGLLGLGMRMDYDIPSGTFNIQLRSVDLAYQDSDGNIYPLTKNQNALYNDCISYKRAEATVIGRDVGSSYITEYNYGYKAKIDNFTIKFIVNVPIRGTVKMQISLSSDKNMNGNLLIMRNDQVIDSISMNLKENIKNNKEWVVR